MNTCPTCDSPVRIVSDKEGTSHYEPALIRDRNYHLRDQAAILRKLTSSLRSILSVREGETVVEAAKRWRKTMEWYADRNNWVAPVDPEHIRDSILNAEFAVEDDLGQRARECLDRTGDKQ